MLHESDAAMPTIFWTVTFLMMLVALTFLVRPFAVGQRHGAFIAIMLGVPAFAFGMYLVLGSPGVASTSQTHESADAGDRASAATGNRGTASVSSLVDGLAARLAESPDDGKGWLLLARSYQHLQRFDEAKDAYAKAVALGQSEPSLDALTRRNAGGGDESTDIAVSGTVRLSDAARSLVQPTDTVFIFARAPGQGGAPAAVMQTNASSWPIEFRLTDAQSMVAGMSLSGLDEVVVTARITRGGGPSEAVQGLEAHSGNVPVNGGEPIDLIIE